MDFARKLAVSLAVVGLLAQPAFACGGAQMGGGCGGGGCGAQMGGGCGSQMGGGCGAQMGGGCGSQMGGCGGGHDMGGFDASGDFNAMRPLRRPILNAAAAPVRATRKIITGWIDVKPVRKVLRNTVLMPSLDGGTEVPVGQLYCELQSMLPEGHAYAGGGPVQETLETTRAISNRLSQRSGAHVTYCLRGAGYVLRTPNVSMQSVAQAVPTDLRGPNFQKVLQDGRNPLDILTEWVAAQNGEQVALEVTGQGYALDAAGCAMQSVECCAYATALLQAVEKADPSYVDHDKLAEFVGWGMARSMNLNVEAQKALANDQRDQLLAKITSNYVD